ncbi:MAG: hypothetical protein AB1941_24330 [Gemmatimonadota bacterium]
MELSPELRDQAVAAAGVVTGDPAWATDPNARAEDFPVGSLVAVHHHRHLRVSVVTGTTGRRVEVALTTPSAVAEARRFAARLAAVDLDTYAAQVRRQALDDHAHDRALLAAAEAPPEPGRTPPHPDAVERARQVLAEHPDAEAYADWDVERALAEMQEWRARLWQAWVHVTTRSVPFAGAARRRDVAAGGAAPPGQVP